MHLKKPTHVSLTKKRLRFILDNLKQFVPDNARILDVGCGNGIISTHLASHGYNVLGIDVSEKAIQKANDSNSYPNLEFKVLSAEALASSGQTYDAIVCSEVLEHLDDPSQLLSKLHISLKATGILIVTVPNGKGPRETFVTRPVIKLRKNNGSMWKGLQKIKKALGYSGSTTQSDADNLDHVQFFSKHDLLKLLQSNKFTMLKFGKANFVDDVFPFSFFANRITVLQKIDCAVADVLPYQFTGGFNTIWKKS
ncbi:MAG: methyltransferase domain-containing protein [Bacteroidia bacterium]|nr:methyltransferase domain-containing protein [Bacteroidia bacterium]